MPLPTFSVTDTVTPNLMSHAAAIEGQLEKLVVKTAADIQGDMRRAMASPKHGRVYTAFSISKKGGKKRLTHTASKAGEAPAFDSGALHDSITIKAGRHKLQKIVLVGMEYGLYLEMGTMRIRPRPFMGPAVVRAIPAFKADVKHIMGRK